MSNIIQIVSIYRTLSPARLSTYQKLADSAHNKDEYALLLYLWNMELSESFYIPIQTLEVSLRNTIATAIEQSFGSKWYLQKRFKTILNRWGQDTLDEAINKSKRRHNIEAGDIIAQLSFGFWRELLKSRYEPHIWKKHFSKAFPNIPSDKNRQQVYDNVDKLIKLRNRISHHEPIIKEDKLLQLHQATLDTIDWICPETKRWVEFNSRFQDVYHNRPKLPSSAVDKSNS